MKQDCQEVPQIPSLLGNPRFSKSPACGTNNGTGPAPWSWSTLRPLFLTGALRTLCPGPAAVLGALVEMGTAKGAAPEADSQRELYLASLNHPAEEMAAL